MFCKVIVAFTSLAVLVSAVPMRRATCSNGRTATDAAVSSLLMHLLVGALLTRPAVLCLV